eukprot:CFRG4685T1
MASTMALVGGNGTGIGLPSLEERPAEVTQYSVNQTEYLGSDNQCAAIACVAARRFLQLRGSGLLFVKTDDECMRLIGEGVVFHSRWMSADLKRTADDLASVDEICRLEKIGVSIDTATFYAGQLENNTFGISLVKSIKKIFAPEATSPAAYILTTRGYSTMIGRIADKAVLFDSHPRNKVGMANKEGKAIRAVFHGNKTLMIYLKQLYKTRTHPDLMYTLEHMLLDENVPVEGCVQVKMDEFAFRMQGVTNTAKNFKHTLSSKWTGMSNNLKQNLTTSGNSRTISITEPGHAKPQESSVCAGTNDGGVNEQDSEHKTTNVSSAANSHMS